MNRQGSGPSQLGHFHLGMESPMCSDTTWSPPCCLRAMRQALMFLQTSVSPSRQFFSCTTAVSDRALVPLACERFSVLAHPANSACGGFRCRNLPPEAFSVYTSNCTLAVVRAIVLEYGQRNMDGYSTQQWQILKISCEGIAQEKLNVVKFTQQDTHPYGSFQNGGRH